MMIDERTYERFMEKVCPEPNSGCWLWMGACDPSHTAMFTIKGRTVRASRFSFAWYKGEVPEGHIVHHICNVPCCVNPDHLIPATRQQNVVDGRYRMGRPDGIISLETSLREWRDRTGGSAVHRIDQPDWRKRLMAEIDAYVARTGSSYRHLSISAGLGQNFVTQFMAQKWKEPRFGAVVELCRIMGISVADLDAERKRSECAA